MRLYELTVGSPSNAIRACEQLAEYLVSLEALSDFRSVERTENRRKVEPIASLKALQRIIYQNYSGARFRIVKSLFTCRGIDFGFDTQIYLLLSQSDETNSLERYWEVTEMTQHLIISDQFDGFL
jgi:hypothetical protein